MHEFTDENIQSVIDSNKIVVVDFFAPWCGPCKMLASILDKIADKNQNVIVGKLNADEHIKSANKYNITKLPTIIFFKDGKKVERMIGLQTEKNIQTILNTILN